MRNRVALLAALASAMSIPYHATPMEIANDYSEGAYLPNLRIRNKTYGPSHRPRSQKKYRQLRRRNGSYPAARSGRACA